MNRVQKAAQDWTSNAIDKCMEDPKYAAKVNSGKWCAACDDSRPCDCDMNAATVEMRAYYEENRRTLLRPEPTLIGSWGVKYDALMQGLFKIAAKHLR
jgi:hypothetical protein